MADVNVKELPYPPFVDNGLSNRVKGDEVFSLCLFLDNNSSIAILANMSPFQQFNIAPSHSRITTEKERFPNLFIQAGRIEELNIFLSLQVIFANLIPI